MADAFGLYPGERIVAGVVTEDPDLCCSIEAAGSGIIPHIVIACHEEVKRVVVMSNDTYLVIYI